MILRHYCRKNRIAIPEVYEIKKFLDFIPKLFDNIGSPPFYKKDSRYDDFERKENSI